MYANIPVSNGLDVVYEEPWSLSGYFEKILVKLGSI